MTTTHAGKIINQHLIDRLGVLEPAHMAAVEDEAANAYMLGMPAATAQDVALTLFWRAHGHATSCTRLTMVQILAPGLSPAQQREHANRLANVSKKIIATVQDTRTDYTALDVVWATEVNFGALLREALHHLS